MKNFKRLFILTTFLSATLNLSNISHAAPPQKNSPVVARTIEGVYTAEGKNPPGDGETYTVPSVSISRQGSKYIVRWGGNYQQQGVGVLKGNTLHVVFGKGNNPKGEAVYNIGSGGILSGRWRLFSNPNEYGYETLKLLSDVPYERSRDLPKPNENGVEESQ